MARASSGSRSSISSMEPLMSANSAVTVLRSPSRLSVASEDALITCLGENAVPTSARGSLLLISDDPHSPQYLNGATFSTPHFGQRTRSRPPHSPQNFRSDVLSVPHFEQIM